MCPLILSGYLTRQIKASLKFVLSCIRVVGDLFEVMKWPYSEDEDEPASASADDEAGLQALTE